ncbi:MAG TPA: hypothetical protein VGD66_00865 [Allosphingosinicella sp.]
MRQQKSSPQRILNRAARRFGWPMGLKSGKRRGEEGEPALVEPDRPNPPLEGGAAASLEEEGS